MAIELPPRRIPFTQLGRSVAPYWRLYRIHRPARDPQQMVQTKSSAIFRVLHLVYAIIGVATRTAQISEYPRRHTGGAPHNGMATGADWPSAPFVGMGTLFLLGYDGRLGAWLTGGFVLVSILGRPYLRKFGAYTVPDFCRSDIMGNFTCFFG
jgi:Na+(H+)/acetate symporter ActP